MAREKTQKHLHICFVLCTAGDVWVRNPFSVLVQVALLPPQKLAAGAKYQLRLEAGAVMDLSGNALEEVEDPRHFQVESGFDGTLTDYKPPQVPRV